MGGAASHDKHLRKENKTWWAREMPSKEEYEIAMDNLERYNYKIDYIITHCCPSSVLSQISPYYQTDEMGKFFQMVKEDIEYKRWFFGHYHEDKAYNNKDVCVYDNIIKL